MASPSLQGKRVLETEESNLQLRLNRIVIGPMWRPFMCIFTEMTKGKDPKEDLMTYFAGIKMKVNNKTFDNTQKKKIASDPSCSSFDITLLFRIIQVYCDKAKDQTGQVRIIPDDALLLHMKDIKEQRNDIMHGIVGLNKVRFDSIVQLLHDLLEKTWEKIEDVFGIDASKEVQKMEEDMKIIKEAPLEDLRVYYTELQALLDTEGVESMKENYKQYLSEAPDVHLLDESLATRQQTKILDVFTEMHILYEHGKKAIHFREWLTELEKERATQNKLSKFLLVDGVAGVGKTTLSRKIVLDWIYKNNTMDLLDDFQLLIYMQFRERHIKSLSALCLSVMPYMRGKVDLEMLMSLTEGRDIIFVCDGLDEKNDESQNLFKELLCYGEKRAITVVCTTRPEEIDRLTVSSQYAYLRIQVVGISQRNRSTFINKYFKSRRPDKDPQPLLNYLNKTAIRLQEHWRFPYNLMCLAMLWILAPTRINTLTTATELFEATLDEITKKLNSRQLDKDISSVDLEDLMKTFYHVALINHALGDIVLSDDSFQTLKSECLHKKLNWRTVISTFLTQNVSWSSSGESSFSFPHKGLQDFYAAKSILEKLYACTPDEEKVLSGVQKLLQESSYSQEQRNAILNSLNPLLSSQNDRTIREILQTIAKEASSSSQMEDIIKRSPNVLTHLAGILSYRGKVLVEKQAEELVQLLKESGIQTINQWLDLLELTKCDGTLCRLIAPQVIEDDYIVVEDSRVQAYASLLPHHSRTISTITVDISSDPQDIPCLRNLFDIISGRQEELSLYLKHEYEHPKLGGSCMEDKFQQLRLVPPTKTLQLSLIMFRRNNYADNNNNN